jgi:hypothetical protein
LDRSKSIAIILDKTCSTFATTKRRRRTSGCSARTTSGESCAKWMHIWRATRRRLLGEGSSLKACSLLGRVSVRFGSCAWETCASSTTSIENDGRLLCGPFAARGARRQRRSYEGCGTR